jgi:hypothetical protein
MFFNKVSVTQLYSGCLRLCCSAEILSHKLLQFASMHIWSLPIRSEFFYRPHFVSYTHTCHIMCDLHSNYNREKLVTWSHQLPLAYTLCKCLQAFACMFSLGTFPTLCHTTYMLTYIIQLFTLNLLGKPPVFSSFVSWNFIYLQMLRLLWERLNASSFFLQPSKHLLLRRLSLLL